MQEGLLRLARRCAIALLLLAATAGAHAGSFRGTVTHVTDGDTLWVRPDHGGEPLELRLRNLDAPEGCQQHGSEAGQALAQRVLRQQVNVRTAGFDNYHRVLAQVRHRGEDVGAWLVREGHAWSATYKGRRGPYAGLETQAREARRGLWAQPQPQEPRSFRRAHGRCT